MQKMYKIKEVCDKLQIKRYTIDRLIKTKKIKTVNLNKGWSNKVLRIPEESINAFILSSVEDE